MAILHLIPRLIAERDGQAKYLCDGCGQITDWIARPTAELAESVCPCGRMLEKVPKIVDYRKVDGRATYHCDNCNSTTSYILVPTEPGFKVMHGCDVKNFQMPNGTVVDATPANIVTPCAAGMIALSEMKIIEAVDKIGNRTPALTKFLTKQLLPKFQEMRKLVAEDDVKAALERK